VAQALCAKQTPRKTSEYSRGQGDVAEWAHQTLCVRGRKVSAYIRSHTRFLVDYGARYRKGLPISSGIAESAVNQVVSTRMAKKQQMRWSDEGAHTLALVRVADLNEELSAELLTPVTQCRPNVVEKIDMAFYGIAA
jgi:hypothetical protein